LRVENRAFTFTIAICKNNFKKVEKRFDKKIKRIIIEEKSPDKGR
jgi:hypothetical protein